MKRITESKLREIIREEATGILGGTRPEDVDTREDAWAGGDNLEMPLDLSSLILDIETVGVEEDKPTVKENKGILDQISYDTVLVELNFDPHNAMRHILPLMRATGTTCPVSAATALAEALRLAKEKGIIG